MAQLTIPTFHHLPSMAKCHRLAFPKALSTAMGQKYVEKMLEWYLVDERAFIFILSEEGNCVGYCGGLKFSGTAGVGSASSMIQYSFHEALTRFLLNPWLFFHPEFMAKYKLAFRNFVKRVGSRFKIKEKTRVISPSQGAEAHAGLVVIGVDPRKQSKGYGSLLLQEFERISSSLGFKKMSLTVRTDNDRAIKSYLRNGWVSIHVDERSTRMEKHISS